MNDKKLRASLIRLAHAKPELQAEILPLLKEAAGKNSYIALYRGKHIEVYADTTYEAQQIAAKQFKARKDYDVSVILAEKDGKQVTHLPLMASAKKTAGIGTMQVNYIKRDALELVEAVQSQEAVEIMFLQLLDSCTAFAKYGLKNMAVSRILDKAVDLLADTEGSTLDTTGEPSRTYID